MDTSKGSKIKRMENKDEKASKLNTPENERIIGA